MPLLGHDSRLPVRPWLGRVRTLQMALTAGSLPVPCRAHLARSGEVGSLAALRRQACTAALKAHPVSDIDVPW